MNDLDESQKTLIRHDLMESARKLLGVKYEFGAEWTKYEFIPESIDCSEMVEGIYTLHKLKMPDGSQNQFNFTVPVPAPRVGDLGFFGRGRSDNQIYHVGMVFDKTVVIEARGFDPTAKFETGKIILRPIWNWQNYKNFTGWRSHPKLA